MIYYTCNSNVLDNLSWCCNVLKTYEDFVPWVTWGSLRDQETRNTWNTKNCNHLVGGSEKSQCSGKFLYKALTLIFLRAHTLIETIYENVINHL